MQIVSFAINADGICWQRIDYVDARNQKIRALARTGLKAPSIAERFGLLKSDVELILKINAEVVDCDNKKNHEDWNERNEELPF